MLYEHVHSGQVEDIDRTLALAFEKLQSAHQANPSSRILEALGTIAFAQADRTTGTAAERLLQEAKCRYVEALNRDSRLSTYNLACVCARLGEISECRQWLEKSGEPEWLLTRSELASDPELVAVRECAWFQAILAKWS
jgi:hypothetical protein